MQTLSPRGSQQGEQQQAVHLDGEHVMNCLRAGWTLFNRGPGWCLQPQHRPYRVEWPLWVADELITRLCLQGVIEVKQAYVSAHVRLREK